MPCTVPQLGRQSRTDIMDQISNNVVVTGMVIGVIDAGAATLAAFSRYVMYVVAHDSDKRAQV